MNTFVIAVHQDPYLPPGIDDDWCERYGAISEEHPVSLEEFINPNQDENLSS